MSGSTIPAAQSQQPTQPNWAPFLVPPVAASVAIVPVFRDLIAKSQLQKGEVPHITFREGLKQGVKAVPTVGTLIGVQMLLQSFFEKKLLGEEAKETLSAKLASSALVGIASSPVVAVFNGQTLKGGGVFESLRKFSARQCMVISLQEAAFVAGLSAASLVAAPLKDCFGDNKPVEYAATFTAGVFGSLAGHPANTALTRWQSELPIESGRQLMWGSLRKARAIGMFAVLYKMGKETASRVIENSN